MSEVPCLLCEPDPDLVFYRGALVLGLWDAFPPNGGRVLLVPKRHVPTWLDATREEQDELFSALAIAHKAVLDGYGPRGYDIDIRDGLHLHVRLFPKAIPSAPLPDRVVDRSPAPTFEASLPGLVTGESDPLLPYLKRHLDEAESADLLASFILESGVALLEGHLEDLLDRGGRVRVLTGDYLGITEPNALLRLLDLQEGTKGALDARIFYSVGTSFQTSLKGPTSSTARAPSPTSGAPT